VARSAVRPRSCSSCWAEGALVLPLPPGLPSPLSGPVRGDGCQTDTFNRNMDQ
jgi:hypothetical protein